MTTTLRRGFGAGVRVAIAPLVTDTPIIAISVAAISAVPAGWVRAIAIAGGLALIAMGSWEISRARQNSAHEEPVAGSGQDIAKGLSAYDADDAATRLAAFTGRQV